MKAPSPCEMDEEILTQAAHWCMRLQDDTCTTEERLAFQHWIQIDPRHAFEYAKMLEIWELSDGSPNNKSTSKKLLTDTSPLHDGVRKM
ncbi:FecR/PupR family sigma factor regulator [Pseudomonas sp. CT11-2]|jgi:transmembrane sensor|uniref:FecR/PupR family sigma factor regulator n=1 Tax=unclassified Pseudomonas TaxID=196821 RepID=UPI0003A45B25|nr:DUF4880 domain-containing protein [Pseudomonas sp. B21-019]UVM34841.1 DUF4880 domain-containing protein [Pseudomonas sp. B21-019]